MHWILHIELLHSTYIFNLIFLYCTCSHSLSANMHEMPEDAPLIQGRPGLHGEGLAGGDEWKTSYVISNRIFLLTAGNFSREVRCEYWEYLFVAYVSYLQKFHGRRWHLDADGLEIQRCGPSFEHSLSPKTSTLHTLVSEMLSHLDPPCNWWKLNKTMVPCTNSVVLNICRRQPLSRTWCYIEVWWLCWSRHPGPSESGTFWKLQCKNNELWNELKATA